MKIEITENQRAAILAGLRKLQSLTTWERNALLNYEGAQPFTEPELKELIDDIAAAG